MNGEPDFSNREIVAMFDHIKDQLKDIKEQTTKTNGRVTKLEVKQEGLMVKVTSVATVVSAGIIALVNRVI